MENNATYDYKSINSVLFHIYNNFGYEDVKDMEVYNAAQQVLPIIGNTHVETYHYIGKASDLGFVKIPCNVDKIEAVTSGTGLEDYILSLTGEAQLAANQIEGLTAFRYLKQTKSNLHAPGSFINYKFTGDKIEVDPVYFDVPIYVIYKGFIADEDGNPMVTEKEAIAIAYYYNYLRQQKTLYNGTGDSNLFTLAQTQKDQKISQARSPVYITQNEMDQYKRIHKSANRWSYRVPYKYTI